MGVLTAVVEVTTLPVFDPRQDLPFRRAVALQLVGDDHPWHVLQSLEQLTKELLGGFFIPAALHQNVEDVVVLVDSTPQGMAFAIDGEKHFIEMPFVPWLGASVLQLMRVVLPEFQTPRADGLMSDVDTALAQDLLHVAITQGETVGESDAMADDLPGEAMILVACGVSGGSHGGCLFCG